MKQPVFVGPKEQLQKELLASRKRLSEETYKYLSGLLALKYSALSDRPIGERQQAELAKRPLYTKIARYNLYHQAEQNIAEIRRTVESRIVDNYTYGGKDAFIYQAYLPPKITRTLYPLYQYVVNEERTAYPLGRIEVTKFIEPENAETPSDDPAIPAGHETVRTFIHLYGVHIGEKELSSYTQPQCIRMARFGAEVLIHVNTI